MLQLTGFSLRFLFEIASNSEFPGSRNDCNYRKLTELSRGSCQITVRRRIFKRVSVPYRRIIQKRKSSPSAQGLFAPRLRSSRERQSRLIAWHAAIHADHRGYFQPDKKKLKRIPEDGRARQSSLLYRIHRRLRCALGGRGCRG